MEHLPNDPAMLVSAINMLLRDNEFENLKSLCNYYDRDLEQLVDTLRNLGYNFDEQQQQFKVL